MSLYTPVEFYILDVFSFKLNLSWYLCCSETWLKTPWKADKGADCVCRCLSSDEGNWNDSRMAIHLLKGFFFYYVIEEKVSLPSVWANKQPAQDHGLQKLDKDFIGNWITYLFYTYFINDTGFLHCSFFANITASCQQNKPKKGNQKPTRDEDGTWACFNLQLWFAFQAFFNKNDSLCKPTRDSSKQSAHSEQTQKNNVVLKTKHCWGCMKKNRRGEKFSAWYANTVRQTLVRGMSKGQGQAGVLILGAPRVDCAFLFVHAHRGGSFMGLNKVLMESLSSRLAGIVVRFWQGPLFQTQPRPPTAPFITRNLYKQRP